MYQTNWFVITGAPCSGKTTLIREIEQKGYPVVHETARAFIDEQLKKGLTVEAIKSDVHEFEREILLRKVSVESKLPARTTIFFDRGVPDSIAYYRREGLDDAEALEKSRLFRYRHIFFLERLHFKKDAVRVENESTVKHLEALIFSCYRELGYRPVYVPLLSIHQRLELILRCI